MLNSLSYLHTPPLSNAIIRQSPNDFLVTELLGFEPSGEGEHVFLYIRKTGENTDWVAKKLAEFAKVRPHDVAYAGKKDRHAVTEQWFSVWLPGNKHLDWQKVASNSIEILKVTSHTLKLKLGVLLGNRFQIILRSVSDVNDLLARENKVAQGVPNYFGPQRFGIGGGNLVKGQKLLRNELRERNKNKRGLYISAVRSHLFNQVISQRIAQRHWDKVLLGDALMLNGSQSCFVVDDDIAGAQARLDARDVHLTGPMWGRGKLLSCADAQQWEELVVKEYESLCEGLEGIGLNQERRSLRLLPDGLRLKQLDASSIEVKFSLPAGSFATSVLRELCNASEVGEESK